MAGVPSHFTLPCSAPDLMRGTAKRKVTRRLAIAATAGALSITIAGCTSSDQHLSAQTTSASPTVSVTVPASHAASLVPARTSPVPDPSTPPPTTTQPPTSTDTTEHTPTPKRTPSTTPTPTLTPSSTPSRLTTPPAGQPLHGKVIVLDPGHNLNNSSSINRIIDAGNGVHKACDTVGTSTKGGYPEHAFTWDVAHRTATILRAEGATVILTRSSDTGIGPCVPDRAKIGNDAHADAFIAIHADGGPTTGHGFFVMQPPPNNPNVNPGGATRSRVLATTMHDVFHATTGIPFSSYISNGYYPDSTTTGTINLSHGPVITIECLDMRNAGDAAIATSANGRQNIANGIAAGLTAFLRS